MVARAFAMSSMRYARELLIGNGCALMLRQVFDRALQQIDPLEGLEVGPESMSARDCTTDVRAQDRDIQAAIRNAAGPKPASEWWRSLAESNR